jgi:hypothetical protein
MPALAEVLGHWHEFYMLLGTVAGTLVGLLFVAASVSSGVFSSDRSAPLRVFLSASVVNFGSILAVSLIILTPVQNWMLFGTMILGCGIVGLAYYGLAWRDAVRDGLSAAIDLEDRVWYFALPVVGYLFVAGSGVTLALELDLGCLALALSTGMLLVIGIHNAWDITVWIITRRRE